MTNQQKMRNEKEGNLPKPLPSFFSYNSIIQNFKNSKLFEPSKYKKTT